MLMFDAVIFSRPDHPNVVFTSMEEIMTLLIEESDEISMELLQPLLDSVRKENQAINLILVILLIMFL